MWKNGQALPLGRLISLYVMFMNTHLKAYNKEISKGP